MTKEDWPLPFGHTDSLDIERDRFIYRWRKCQVKQSIAAALLFNGFVQFGKPIWTIIISGYILIHFEEFLKFLILSIFNLYQK